MGEVTPEVYERAAEIILRDGRTRRKFFEPDSEYQDTRVSIENVKSGCQVCALGACIRAEYELTGSLPGRVMEHVLSVYDRYNFYVDRLFDCGDGELTTVEGNIWEVNDYSDLTDEQIAEVLRRKAEKLRAGDDGPVDATDF